MVVATSGSAFQPTQIYYLVSFQCNQRCSKCRHWKKPVQEVILDPALIVAALKTLAPVQEFCIVGGEPLIHAETILTILSSTADLRHRTVIVTNGVCLSPDLVDRLAEFNIHLVVSVDTLDREFWRYVRGADSYDRVMTNLDYAVKIFSPDQLSLQSVRAKETEPHLMAVREYCRQRGIHHSIQDYVQDGFDGEWTPSAEETPHAEVGGDSGACYAAGRNLSIDPTGNINTCFQQYLIPGCAEPLGNLNESSMEEMLTSSYSRSVQKAMLMCSLPCRVLKCNQED